MEYVKKDLGAYNLHLIKTDKFKTHYRILKTLNNIQIINI